MSTGDRFVVFLGPRASPEIARLRLEAVPGIRVVEDAGPCLWLVEGPEEELRSLLSDLDDVAISRQERIEIAARPR